MQVSRRLAGLLAHGLLQLTVTGREYLPPAGVLLRPVGVAEAGRAATKATIAVTAEPIRLLLADHVRITAAQLGAPPLAPADPGGPDR
jgi:hypothetical protein